MRIPFSAGINNPWTDSNYQVASAEMKATPLHKDFLKRQNPHEEVVYREVPELIYAV